MFRNMEDVPPFLRFAPVPLRAQHNGWTAPRQLRFVLDLARGAGPSEAAKRLGMTRQSAYNLRKRPGAEGFAAAWDEAQDFARRARAAASHSVANNGGIETILVPRHYRGRLIGFVQREDMSGAMRLLGRLDRLADKFGDCEEMRALSERPEGFEALMRIDSLDANCR